MINLPLKIPAAIVAAILLAAGLATAQDASQDATEPVPHRTLITNALIFDGTSDALTAPMNVLVEGDKIKQIADSIDAPDGATVIDANGRTLSPGFNACHEHVTFQMNSIDLLLGDTRYQTARATDTVRTYLMNGYTSVREAAGNTFGLKRAIDEGFVVGPRIFPSGPMISQTGGHADHRRFDWPEAAGGVPDMAVRNFDMAVTDGVPEVLKAVREALRMGATQIKIAVGGGSGSYADPLEVVEFLPEEIQAATRAAADYQTYVMAHVYNTAGIRRAIENGVKSIEHGNLVDEPTLQLMKDKDVWLCAQVIVYTMIPNGYTPEQAAKHREAYAGIDNMFTAAKKIGFENIGFGFDIITDPDVVKRQNDEFVLRTKWFDNAEILRQATSKSGALIGMSNRFNPGKIGVIEEGALADILLINGDPLQDISILTDPEANLALIMKGGEIFKNTVSE
jgi:imidazolonepropionase-like amidohydrolase